MIEELFGGWSIEWKVFSWIINHLPNGSRILELGSGRVSGELNRYYHLTSIEHSENFLNKYDTNYIYSPYNFPNMSNTWYSLEQVPPYDLLLIDGPDHSTRKNILYHMHLFDWSKPVIVDDVQEDDLLELAKNISSNYCNRPYEIIDGQIKKAMVIP